MDALARYRPNKADVVEFQQQQEGDKAAGASSPQEGVNKADASSSDAQA